MNEIPRDDPRAQRIAHSLEIDRRELIEHVASRHAWVLATTRRDGRPHLSLISGAITDDGTMIMSTYPQRFKTRNAQRDPNVSVLVMGNDFISPTVQVDGTAKVVLMPDAYDYLVHYQTTVAGADQDWNEYRKKMTEQKKAALVVTPTRWGRINTGGYPPELFEAE